jgi:hypothetical protein
MGLLLDTQDCLRRMISRCVALQSWSGNTFTEAQLLDRVYLDAIPEPAVGSVHTLEELQALRPFVLVGINSESPIRIQRDAMGGGSSFTPSGSLVMMIEQATEGDTEAEIDRNFATKLESFLFSGNPSQPGLIDQLDAADSIAIQEIHGEGIFRVQPEDEVSKGSAQRAYFRIDWGTGR